MINKSILVKLFGFPATLIHGDTLELDRWLWLKKRLPISKTKERLLDVGCGSGAFSIGSALRGYRTLGLNWNNQEKNKAEKRAEICNAKMAKFEEFDVRNLDTQNDLKEKFDIIICFENIEHIINDIKLMKDISNCLNPGGKLFLTTPNIDFHPITASDKGPYSKIENGEHVRKGYSANGLKLLCSQSGLEVKKITFCSGLLSQKITFLFRKLSNINLLFGWLIVLPLRILPVLFDRLVTNVFHWPYFSICLEAIKPYRNR